MRRRLQGREGQVTLLLLGVVAVVIAGSLVVGAFAQALGSKGRHQRAADLAAMSAARVMRTAYPRLFEPAWLRPGVHNPRHLPLARYLALGKAAAVRAAQRNDVRLDARDVLYPGGSFAPTRVRVALRGVAEVGLPGASAREGGSGRDARGGDRGAQRGSRTVPVSARAAAEFVPDAGQALMPAVGTGGGYDGPLAYRMGKPMRPEVAVAFDRLAAAARREAGLALSVTSGFRSDAEQARLFAANPNPRWVAPPGKSLHRNGTELDLGPPAAYGWLAGNARRFGFLKRYSWEPWHFGFTGAGQGGAGQGGGGHAQGRDDPASWEPPGGDHAQARHRLPSFVPARFHDVIARASLRWNVPMAVLAAQLYAESGFNPFARSPAGAEGIAQFMPGTADAYGLRDPYEPVAAINAQAHLMSDLLRRFGGKVALALAAYNAGPGAVERHDGVPPFAETRAYVARILGLLGGAGELVAPAAFEIRLVE